MKALKPLVLFCIGGLLYVLCELIFRGHSHWTMFIVGGICFIKIGMINETFTPDIPLLFQMAVGSLIITAIEFVSGCIINIWLGWDVWDYSNLPFNILGQICLPFSILWFFVSAIAIIADDYMRYWFFGEEKPRYKLF